MRYSFLVLALPLLLSTQAVADTALLENRTAAERPQLMFLGTAHLANHNRDALNPHVDNVLTPARQAQIAKVVDALAVWKPTHIAVEWLHSDQAGLDKRYADYRAGHYTLGPDEIDQLGIALAARLGLARLDAVNWNDSAPGPKSAYDIEAGAKQAGEQPRLNAILGSGYAQKLTGIIQSHSVADFLRILNQPEMLAENDRFYYDIAMLGTPENNIGANWVGYWHGRNFKIFANLVRLNAKPDDRVLVIFGLGHGFLLNEFAQDSHAFRLVRPDTLLRTAAAHGETATPAR